ncbi:MAG TPA: class I SAM-dependent methyltransferase [Bryobacteraceae bacterium]
MNCDRIARSYRWLEYAAFGRELERRRFCFLAETAGAQRALILGDGDGRFLRRLAAVSCASIDYVDLSAGMLELARSRAGARAIAYRQADALKLSLAPAEYDLIVTHFFLDCFDEGGLARLIDRTARAAKPDAVWLISEFRQPAWAAPLLAALYLFFRVTTGLTTRRLTDHRPMLRKQGFRLKREETSRAGLLASELWTRSQ